MRILVNNILLGSKKNGAMHALGYDTPYSAHCTECHGSGLIGTQQAPSCYSCHDSRWKEEPFPGTGPITYMAEYKNGRLNGMGENADPSGVTIVNGINGDILFSENVTLTGSVLLDDTHAEPRGYLSACQTPDGVIHLISSGLHYAFNLTWLKTPIKGEDRG